MDSAQYQSILEEGLLGTARDFGVDLDAFVVQQDNDLKHKSRHIHTWFDKVGLCTLIWPAFSADVNIIENVWSHLKARLHECGRPCNKEELWRVLQEEWHQIDIGYIQKLYSSLPTHIYALLKAKGGNILY